MKIYIIRHGETDSNRLGLLQGGSDRPLNENGIRLARLCGQGMKGIHFDRCISSPLRRASETARIVLQESGNENAGFSFDERLREISMGDWEGKHFRTDEDGVDPEAMKVFFDNAFLFPGFPNGETVVSLTERTQNFLKELAAEDDGSTVFAIDVIPNFELERDILGFGEGITILSPKHLAEKIRQRLRDSLNQYEDNGEE